MTQRHAQGAARRLLLPSRTNQRRFVRAERKPGNAPDLDLGAGLHHAGALRGRKKYAPERHVAVPFCARPPTERTITFFRSQMAMLPSYELVTRRLSRASSQFLTGLGWQGAPGRGRCVRQKDALNVSRSARPSPPKKRPLLMMPSAD